MFERIARIVMAICLSVPLVFLLLRVIKALISQKLDKDRLPRHFLIFFLITLLLAVGLFLLFFIIRNFIFPSIEVPVFWERTGMVVSLIFLFMVFAFVFGLGYVGQSGISGRKAAIKFYREISKKDNKENSGEENVD